MIYFLSGIALASAVWGFLVYRLHINHQETVVQFEESERTVDEGLRDCPACRARWLSTRV